jgi:hypothetical protein
MQNFFRIFLTKKTCKKNPCIFFFIETKIYKHGSNIGYKPYNDWGDTVSMKKGEQNCSEKKSWKGTKKDMKVE